MLAGLVLGAAAAAQVGNPGFETAKNSQASAAPNAGAQSYAKHCAICHGDQREGILPAFPPLIGIRRQMTSDKIAELIHSGKGRMPGFPSLQNAELHSLLDYLANAESANGALASGAGAANPHGSGPAAAGGVLFGQNCAFCHGRDAMGGESGPDLTRSKLVLGDASGEKISAVIREGRPETKMPAFNFSSQELSSLVAFIRARVVAASSQKGGRRGVEVADLQTGNVDAGKRYFNGAGGCVKCHSPSGDLAGVASRYEGLRLEERMLYPQGARRTAVVTLPSGQKISGTVAYLDEFTIAVHDSEGSYRSWPTNRVHYTVDSPADAHAEQFPKYSDDDIHNLMAYIQTLR